MVHPPYGQGNFSNENFPGAAQTQVVGINNNGDTVGFWVDGKGANHGFYALKGHGAKTADFPTADNANPMVDQLLAVNDHAVAVGFYTDAKGNNHGFSLDIARHQFRAINVPGDSNVTTSGINNQRDVAGFATNAAGATEGYRHPLTARPGRQPTPSHHRAGPRAARHGPCRAYRRPSREARAHGHGRGPAPLPRLRPGDVGAPRAYPRCDSDSRLSVSLWS